METHRIKAHIIDFYRGTNKNREEGVEKLLNKLIKT